MGWSEEEMKSLETGDRRLDKRVKHTLEKLGEGYGGSFPSCFKTRAELVGAYRLFDNKFVTPEKIMKGHYDRTVERAKKFPVVLLINDTSSLDYTSKKVEGLGRIDQDYTQGFFIHPLIAITPERLSLGVVDNNVWLRGNESRGKLSGTMRANQPIEEKESFRWLQSYERARLFAQICINTKFVYVADRESDILELITKGMHEKKHGSNLDFLVRAKHNRTVLNELEDKKLKECLKKAPVITKVGFQIPGRGSQKSRHVEQVIRAKEVTIKGKTVGEKEYSSLKVCAILCIEEAPPAGVEPVIWLLLTSLPIRNEKEVLTIVTYYLSRWEIETFFNVLKSGCNIEGRELKTISRLKAALCLFMIVSWRVMFLMNLSRQDPSRPCNEVFEDAEWMSVCKVLTQKIPKEPPSLNDFMKMIGRLGGYLPRKSPPGVKVIWEGLKKMANYVSLWETIHP